ncbi:unnamed protein product [Linum tenue]|uniref:Uncharacterized protein n=1 Tax=Linum tenue TaxID=586396 RepID=A0AAV0NS48_9ROSI|nr:unnamed protein product [Linum tenue]
MQHLFAAPSSTSLSWLLKSIVIGKVCTLRSEGSCCSAGFGISSSKLVALFGLVECIYRC